MLFALIFNYSWNVLTKYVFFFSFFKVLVEFQWLNS